MKVSRKRVDFVTDTGANCAGFCGHVFGKLVQIAYKPADTGVRLDTGADISIYADTGELNELVCKFHLNPPDSPWSRGIEKPIMDTGGNFLNYAVGQPVTGPRYFAGEGISGQIQGVATDTGKEGTIFMYFVT